jgi:predicted DNA-binding ribbon-helix-helix protein
MDRRLALAGEAAMGPICRNVTIAGRRTSVRMEAVLWDSLFEICEREALGLHDLCTRIDRARTSGGLTAALRVFILCYFREASRQVARGREPMPMPVLDTALRRVGSTAA